MPPQVSLIAMGVCQPRLLAVAALLAATFIAGMTSSCPQYLRDTDTDQRGLSSSSLFIGAVLLISDLCISPQVHTGI